MFEFIVLWVGLPTFGIGTGWLLVDRLIVTSQKGQWVQLALVFIAITCNSVVIYALALDGMMVAWILELVFATAVCLRYWRLYCTDVNFHHLN